MLASTTLINGKDELTIEAWEKEVHIQSFEVCPENGPESSVIRIPRQHVSEVVNFLVQAYGLAWQEGVLVETKPAQT